MNLKRIILLHNASNSIFSHKRYKTPKKVFFHYQISQLKFFIEKLIGQNNSLPLISESLEKDLKRLINDERFYDIILKMFGWKERIWM